MPSFRAAAAAVALAAALSGCGSDAEDGAEPVESSLAATLTVTESWTGVYPLATGDAEVSSNDGTTVRLSVAGLGPDQEYTAHVHDGSCSDDPPGGGHWLADASGEDAPGNIIQLSLTTLGDGAGSTEVSSDLALDDRAKSIVVHAPESEVQAEGFESDRVLCGALNTV